jgi:hypothetical protein
LKSHWVPKISESVCFSSGSQEVLCQLESVTFFQCSISRASPNSPHQLRASSSPGPSELKNRSEPKHRLAHHFRSTIQQISCQHLKNHRNSIHAYAIEQQWQQSDVPKNEMSFVHVQKWCSLISKAGHYVALCQLLTRQ